MTAWEQWREGIADEVAKVYMQSSKYLSVLNGKHFRKIQKRAQAFRCGGKAACWKMQETALKVQELIRKLENGEESRSKKELLAEIGSACISGHQIERLDRLQSQIDDIMQRVYGQEQKISTAFYESLAERDVLPFCFLKYRRTQA